MTEPWYNHLKKRRRTKLQRRRRIINKIKRKVSHLLQSLPPYLLPHLRQLLLPHPNKSLLQLHPLQRKVFCTKSRPNCNACPMQRECKHFGSAYASAKLLLTGSLEEDETLQKESSHYGGYGVTSMNSPSIDGEFVANSYCPVIALDYYHDNQQDQSEDLFDLEDFTFIHEEYHVPFDTRPSQLEHFSEPCYLVNSEAEKDNHLNYPSYSVHDNGYHTQGFSIRDHSISSTPRSDCESSFCDRDYIKVPTSRRKLVFGEKTENSIISYQNRRPLHVPQLKKTSRLCTVHYVYEIPDMHPILDEVEPRRKDDPSSYLLAIWSPDEVPHSMIELEGHCSSSPPRSRSTDETVPGTLLIPCKTALRGSFPLNGTYFQVNEVFADHKSSLEPLKVPRSLIWELNRCLVYFGTSLSQIVRGFTRDEIKECFSNGYVCVRGFDRKTRCPKPLVCRLHLCQSREQNKRNANSENS
ncbi:hypothetical protein KP509_16G006200 [Ceratopteris richardii]|uniref:Demeter RRM-fold domain-containing protein n=1 Tax=Ceratopteris richardii TaxID=49495 RepID=A0A8T2SWE6_CERRI|nr:hypothetical protein KP509_16G006200 [Ceratopteris richardii]